MKDRKADYEVAIIGAGFGGLATGIQLKLGGQESFIILERAAEPGGTWRDNIYPGCASDIQSHLYSLSQDPNPDWSQQYPPQSEILDYLKGSVRKFGLHEKIRFHSEVIHMRFDAGLAYWELRTRDGYEFTARVVVMAIGTLNRPNIPNIPGLGDFRGERFHSSRWNYAYDLAGKTVAVIGTGASAIQFVPGIARQVGRMILYQRSAPWVIPKPNRKYAALEKWIFRKLPVLQRLSRYRVYWFNELRGRALLGNKLMLRVIEAVGRFHIWRSIRNPALRAIVQPRHRFGCKRVLLSNDYYPALDRQNVEVIPAAIQSIGKGSIVTEDGSERAVDAIIFGTGFVSAEMHVDLEILGLEGRELLSEWERSDGPEAYLGTTISGFPNLIMLLGPNTGLGHNSVVHMAECQIHYLGEYLKVLRTGGDRSYLNVRAGCQAAYNEELQAKLGDSVWASGCRSWYFTSAGKNTAIWPEAVFHFYRRTRQLELAHYEVVSSQVEKTPVLQP